jgi:hypothetical protein
MRVLADKKKQQLVKQLKRSSVAYWVSLVAFFASLGLAINLIWVFLLVHVVCHVWLASTVADWAAATNRASAVWGLGTYVLGPLGAIVMPMHALISLKSSDST